MTARWRVAGVRSRRIAAPQSPRPERSACVLLASRPSRRHRRPRPRTGPCAALPRRHERARLDHGLHAVQHDARFGRPLQLGRRTRERVGDAAAHATALRRTRRPLRVPVVELARADGVRQRRAVEEPERALDRHRSRLRVRAGSRALAAADRRNGTTNRARTPATRSRGAPSRRSTKVFSPDLVAGPWRQRVPPRRQDAGAAVPDRQLADQRQVAHRESVSRRGPPAARGSRPSIRPTSAGRSPRASPTAATASASRPTTRRRRASARTASSRSSCASRASSRRTRGSTSTAPSRPSARRASTTRMAAAATATTTTSGPRSARRSSSISEMTAPGARSRPSRHPRALPGCAIRYDRTGTSRVGVFLWGLGDPPGVKWNLDWPRREVPELPATARRDALPSFEPPRAPDPQLVPAPNRNVPERSSRSFDDNLGACRACFRACDGGELGAVQGASPTSYREYGEGE